MRTKLKQPKKVNSPKVRQIKPPDYRSFRLNKRLNHPGPKLPGAFKLFKLSLQQLLAYKKLFLGIVAVYLVLTIVFVKGFGLDNNLLDLKASLKEIFTGSTGTLISTLAIFSFLIGATSSANGAAAQVYQSMLLIIVSLAIIWGLRQIQAKNRVSVRDAFYKGMYPLVPFILVLSVISLQLLPLLIGSGLYNLVMANGLAVSFGEKFIWAFLFGLFALLSLYMISSSVFALYIVTLPDVTPMQALRSARGLVHHRRRTVMRKVLFLPAILIFLGAVIMVPLIIWATPLAEWAFFVLTMFSLALVHGYMYRLYRELL